MYPTHVKTDLRLLQRAGKLTSLYCFPFPFLTTGTASGCAGSPGTRTQILQQLHGPVTHRGQWHTLRRAAEVDMQGAGHLLARPLRVPGHYAATSDPMTLSGALDEPGFHLALTKVENTHG